jgi:hypothetical protein
MTWRGVLSMLTGTLSTKHQVPEPTAKPEIRRPKSEGNPKPETRSQAAIRGELIRTSVFGFSQGQVGRVLRLPLEPGGWSLLVLAIKSQNAKDF